MFFLFFLLKHTNLETSPLWCHIDSWYIAKICIWKNCGNFQAKKIANFNYGQNKLTYNIAAPWKVAPLGSRMKNDDPETKYSEYINLRWLFFCIIYSVYHFISSSILNLMACSRSPSETALCFVHNCNVFHLDADIFRKCQIWLDPFLGSSYFNLYFYCIFYAYHSLYCSEVLYQPLWSC